MRIPWLALSAASSLVNASPLVLRDTSAKEKATLATYVKQGFCFDYLKEGYKNEANTVGLCKIYCEAQHGDALTSWGCLSFRPTGVEIDAAAIDTDDDGMQYVPTTCVCKLELLEEIVAMVIETLPMIDNVLCAGFIQTLQIIADTATVFIPGGGPAVATAARTAVDVAKTLAQNDLGSDAFGKWIGKTCGVEGTNFGYWSVFNVLLAAPDSLGIGAGCLRMKGCKKLDAKPDLPSDKPKDTAAVTPPQAPKTQEIPLSTDQLLLSKTEDLSVSTAQTTQTTTDITHSSIAEVPSLSTQNSDNASTSSSPSLASNSKSVSSTANGESTTTESSSSIGSSTTTAQSTTTPSPEQASTTIQSEDSEESDFDSASTTDDDYDTRSDTHSIVSSMSSADLACQLLKRARKPKKVLVIGNVGDDDERQECVYNVITSHTTITSKPIGWYTSVYSMTCPQKYSQACYHYRSVMSVHTNTPDMVRWTCQATESSGVHGSATADYGASAIGKVGTQQHWWPWANGFLPRTEFYKGSNPIITHVKGCDRDEWPPRAFWPPKTIVDQKSLVQIVRFIPFPDNSGAGQIWRGFCNDRGAASTKLVKQITTSYIKSDYISTIGTARVVSSSDSKNSIAHITSYVSVDTERAVFTFANWDGLPADPVWHGLRQNPCWNSLLAPEDPGFALLTNDEFYLTQHTSLSHHTASYQGYPDITKVRDALGPQNSPPYSFSSYAMASLLKDFRVNTIPVEWFGVLPGLPLVPLRRRSFHGSANSNSTNNIPGVNEHDTRLSMISDQEIENYNDQQLDEWMEEYMELARRQTFEGEAPTKLFRTEAQTTPAGQGDPTPSAIYQGRILAIAGLPQATRV